MSDTPSTPKEAPKCVDCGSPASCFGSYEQCKLGYACDNCCGHGNEDGRCVFIAGIPEAEFAWWMLNWEASIEAEPDQVHVYFWTGAGTAHFYGKTRQEALEKAMKEYPAS